MEQNRGPPFVRPRSGCEVRRTTKPACRNLYPLRRPGLNRNLQATKAAKQLDRDRQRYVGSPPKCSCCPQQCKNLLVRRGHSVGRRAHEAVLNTLASSTRAKQSDCRYQHWKKTKVQAAAG